MSEIILNKNNKNVGNEASSDVGENSKWEDLKEETFRAKDLNWVKKTREGYFKGVDTVVEYGDHALEEEYVEWVKMTPEEIEKYREMKAAQKKQKLDTIKNKIVGIMRGRKN